MIISLISPIKPVTYLQAVQQYDNCPYDWVVGTSCTVSLTSRIDTPKALRFHSMILEQL